MFCISVLAPFNVSLAFLHKYIIDITCNLFSLRVPYQGAQLYPQGGYGQSSAGPWNQYPYSQAYGQTAAAQVRIFITNCRGLFIILHKFF